MSNITALNFSTFLSANLNKINQYNHCVFNEKKNIVDYIAAICNKNPEELYDQMEVRRVLIDNREKMIYFVKGFKLKGKGFIKMKFHALSPDYYGIIFEDNILTEDVIVSEELGDIDEIVYNTVKDLWFFLFDKDYFDIKYLENNNIKITPRKLILEASIYSIFNKIIDINGINFDNYVFSRFFKLIINSEFDKESIKECLQYLSSDEEINDPYKLLQYVYKINNL